MFVFGVLFSWNCLMGYVVKVIIVYNNVVIKVIGFIVMFKSNVGGIVFGIVNSSIRWFVICGECCSFLGFYKILGDFGLVIIYDCFVFC